MLGLCLKTYNNEWKNHFHEMKGDVGIVSRARPSRKERGSGDTRIVKVCRVAGKNVAKVAINYTLL